MVSSSVFALAVNWPVTTLGQACEEGGGGIQTGPFGSQLHKSDYVTVGIPSIMPTNIGDNRISIDGIACISKNDAERLSRYRVQEGDIVYSRRGDVEKRALVRENEIGWLCGTGCLRVRVGNAIDPGYASYYLGHPEIKKWITQHAIGATMPNLNTGILSSLPFVIPPYDDQSAIAHILGSLDDKIDLNRRMNETFEAMAQALFKSWFIDFDPVIDNALVADNPIPEDLQPRAALRESLGDARKPLPDDIRDLFPSEFEFTEEMGWIPKGWEVRTLDDLVDLIGGGTPKTSVNAYWNGDIPWFSVVDAPIFSDVFVIETDKHITQLGVDKSSTKILHIGTSIVTARGTVGKCAMVGKPMAMNQSCYGIRGKDGISDTFVYYTIREKVADLQRSGHGSVFNTITRDTFKTIRIAFSGADLTLKLEKRIKPSFERILANCFHSQDLSKLRDLLLPKLLSGEIRIPEAKQLVEAAV